MTIPASLDLARLDLARLVRQARDEEVAIADLQGCLVRLTVAREAKVALSALPPEQLRAALGMIREPLTKDAS